MNMIQIAAIGLVGASLSLVLRNHKPEFSMMIGLGTAILLFLMILEPLRSVVDFLDLVDQQITHGKSYFLILLKVLAVAYLADFTAQICKDAGETAIADKVELAGKVIIFYLAVPVMMSVLELVNKMLPT